MSTGCTGRTADLYVRRLPRRESSGRFGYRQAPLEALRIHFTCGRHKARFVHRAAVVAALGSSPPRVSLEGACLLPAFRLWTDHCVGDPETRKQRAYEWNRRPFAAKCTA